LPRRRPRTGAGRGEGGEQRETGSGERERDKSVEALFLAVTAQSKRFKPSAVADPEEGEAGGGEERHGGGVAECRREDGDRGHRGKDTRPSKPPYHTPSDWDAHLTVPTLPRRRRGTLAAVAQPFGNSTNQ